MNGGAIRGRAGAGRRGPRGTVAAALLAASVVAGCSSVPDAVNPVEWYRGTARTVGGWFDGESKEKAEAPPEPKANGKPAETASGYPNLASVPPRPEPRTTPEQRAETTRGLVADRESARYTDDPARSASLAAPRAVPPEPVPPSAAPPEPQPAVKDGRHKGDVDQPASPMHPGGVSLLGSPALRVTGDVRSAAERVRDQQRQASPERTRTYTPPPRDEGPRTDAGAGAPPAPPPAAPPPEPPRAAQPEPPRAMTGGAPGGAGAATDRVRQTYQRALEQSAPSTTTEPRPGTVAPSAPDSSSASRPPAAGAGEQLSVLPVHPPGTSQQVATVYFGHGSAAIDGEARQALRKAAEEVKRGAAMVRVVGHASSRTADLDPTRHEIANFEMSAKRADAVARELVRLGVPRERILVEAVGAAQPVYHEAMPAGEAGNRRADVFIEY